jgi:hypothetical protein
MNDIWCPSDLTMRCDFQSMTLELQLKVYSFGRWRPNKPPHPTRREHRALFAIGPAREWAAR